MIDERAYELALSQLAQAREEKMLLFEQVKRLTEEVAMLRSSSDNQADRQAETIKELTNKISDLSVQVEKLNSRIDHLNEVIQMKDEVIKAQNQEIKNLKYEVSNGRRYRFSPTTEQRDLLNNRKTDVEGERKEAFDGTSESLPPESEQPNDDEGDGGTPKKQNRKKEAQKRQPKQPHKVDETITHEVDEYSEVQATDYMMTDETAELVGVVEDGVKSYKKRYLWAFFAKLKNMVFYVYEKSSRARRVALDFLKNFSGFLSTDGYVAYSIFDDAEKHPEIVHIGCWTHVRRYFVEALPCDERAGEIINLIAKLFREEVIYKILDLKPFEIEIRRKRRSNAILNLIHSKVLLMSLDVGLMVNNLMKKAVTYLLHQWKTLRNYIEDGRVEISNNLCEQRMKAVKLNLKNCQNIGSEFAAENAAFMFSVTESCALNGINPESYLEDLFRCILFGTKRNKRDFLPCYYQACELPKMNGLEVAKLLSTAA